MTTREQFLAELRAAVRAASRATIPAAHPESARAERAARPSGDRSELVASFSKAAERAGARLHPAASEEDATRQVLDILAEAGSVPEGTLAPVVTWSREALGPAGEVLGRLEGTGLALAVAPHTDGWEDLRGLAAAAPAGLTGADLLVASTGSLVLRSGPGRPRSVSLLPPVHVAVVFSSCLVPDLAAAGPVLAAWATDPLGANVVLVSGPSRTADIELTLTRGVHGPREVRVVLIDG